MVIETRSKKTKGIYFRATREESAIIHKAVKLAQKENDEITYADFFISACKHFLAENGKKQEKANKNGHSAA